MALTPIARFSTVPYQRVSVGETLNVGVAAFSKAGIASVSFVANDGTADRVTANVVAMSFNPDTGVYEYCFPIPCTAFPTDAEVTVTATVTGSDGGERVLTLALRACPNATGIYTRYYAYVNPTTGVDSTRNVSTNPSTAANAPFLTIGKAADCIQATRNAAGQGNNCDGGVIRLVGNQPWSYGSWGEKVCVNEWLTIESANTGSPVTISGSYGTGVNDCKRLHLRYIAWSGNTRINNTSSFATTAFLWMDHITAVGNGTSNAVGGNWLGVYYTESDVSASGGSILALQSVLARNSAFHDADQDAFANSQCIINCTAYDLRGLEASNHADVVQFHTVNQTNRRADNVVIYGLKAWNANYQGIFAGQDLTVDRFQSEGIALVNVHIKDTTGSEGNANRPWSGWCLSVNHLLIWNCTFNEKSFAILGNTLNGSTAGPLITNFSLHGTVFRKFSSTATDIDEVDLTDAEDNWYTIASGTSVLTPGAAGTGNPGLGTDDRPTVLSAVNGLVSPIMVGVDADGCTRTVPSTIGAYEYSNSSPALSITSSPATYPHGSSHLVEATATDDEDGSLTSAIVWTSNIQTLDRVTGGTLDTAILEVGTHTMTASVTDSSGVTTSETLQIVIVGDISPKTITATSITASTIYLSCPVATGGSGTFTYQWYKTTTGDMSPVNGATSSDFSNTNLEPNTTYYYARYVTDTATNVTVSTPTFAVTTDPVLTSGVITSISLGSTKSTLSFSNPLGGSREYVFQWYRGTSSGFTVNETTAITDAISQTLSDSGLTANTAYFYKVIVTDSHGNVAESPEFTITTTKALTSGTLTLVSKGATITTVASTQSTEGVGPYTYQWHRSTTSGFTPDETSAIAGARNLTLNDTSMTPATTYYYVLQTTDAEGSVVNTDELTVKTQFASTISRTGYTVDVGGIGDSASIDNWQPIFDSINKHAECGIPLKSVWFVVSGTQNVNIRIYGLHDTPDGVSYETHGASTDEIIRTAYRGDKGLITRIEVNAALAGGKISWGPLW